MNNLSLWSLVLLPGWMLPALDGDAEMCLFDQATRTLQNLELKNGIPPVTSSQRNGMSSFRLRETS